MFLGYSSVLKLPRWNKLFAKNFLFIYLFIYLFIIFLQDKNCQYLHKSKTVFQVCPFSWNYLQTFFVGVFVDKESTTK